MFGFGKKKKAEQENIDLEKEAAKIPSGMKDATERMISGQFDMNDMLAQFKQLKKMSSYGGFLKILPGMSNAINVMREKVKDGSVDAKIRILEAMTVEERADPEKIFANAKARIAETAGCSVREVEHMIKQYFHMKRQMLMIQRVGGMDVIMKRMGFPVKKPSAK